MARPATGTYFKKSGGWAVRWSENGKRPFRGGFKTKTAARDWFADNVAPKLRSGSPSGEITFDQFCDLWLARHGATVAPRTRETYAERLKPTRAFFGSWTLREFEGAAGEIAAWRATMPESRHYPLMNVLRMVCKAAIAWRYMHYNPAVESGRNPQPRKKEIVPFTRDEIDRIVPELGPYGPLVVFAVETGLRPNEWVALERRDIDAGAVQIQRRVSSRGTLTPYPKTARSRRRVPLTARAGAALDGLVPRIDTPLLFPAPEGSHIRLENWRNRDWYPALEAAGVERRVPYNLRHTFASEALAAETPIWELARFMGNSVNEIDVTYGHLSRESEDVFRARLEGRGR